MAKENVNELSKKLRERGLSCDSLARKIKQQEKDAIEFQKIGFNRLANTERNVANQLKQLRRKVCRKL